MRDPASTARRRPERAELLLPAGDLERLKSAILYGADAVYAGTPDLSLRTKSGFSLEALAEGVRYAHERGKRVYLTLNLFTHNRDTERLEAALEAFRAIGPDGVIVADLGVFAYLRKRAPELELHISTQANVLSHLTVDAWHELGAELVVMAREVSFAELSEIRERCPDVRLETFVHGAMCMTYSGRCLLSNYMAERGSNQGSCAHSCRWKYTLKVKRADGSEGSVEITDQNMHEFDFFLEEEFRPGELFPIEEDERGSYIMNSRDLCLMPRLADYLGLGVDSLKVEGRNKSEFYLAVVGRAYRAAIDRYYADPSTFDPTPFVDELMMVPNRGYTEGFFSGRLDSTGQNYSSSLSLSYFEYGGLVRSVDDSAVIVEVRNRLMAGDVLEFLVPGTLAVLRIRLYEFVSAETGKTTDKVTAGEGRAIHIPLSAFHTHDPEQVRALLSPGVVARKARPLRPEEEAQLGQDRRSFAVEQGLLPASALLGSSSRAPLGGGRPPKLGALGCCGLGCNGCLPFWNEDRYKNAREKLAGRDGLRLC
jgi:U32 family peptidase